MDKKSEEKSFSDILSLLRNKDVSSLYVLEGQEEYLKDKIVSALKQIIIEPATMQLDYIMINADGKSDDLLIEKIKTEINTPPFMSKKRLVIVKNSNLFGSSSKRGASGSKTENKFDKQESIINLLEQTNDYSCLVILEEKVDKRQKKLIGIIYEHGILGDISKPDIRTIRSWVVKELSKENISITPDACDNLIERNDGKLLQISGELEKLILYVSSVSKNIIQEDDVNNIGNIDLKGSIFNLTDALSQADATLAFNILDVLITQKQPIPLISFMISRHFKQLLIAKSIGNAKSIIKEMKVIPFVANKLLSQSKKVSMNSLEKIYNQCIENEVAVKTSKIPERLSIELLLGYIMENIKS